LREAAKARFLDKLGPALQAYAKANNGQPPTRLADATPYFDAPLEPTILDRYQMVRQRDIPNLRLSDKPDELIVWGDVALSTLQALEVCRALYLAPAAAHTSTATRFPAGTVTGKPAANSDPVRFRTGSRPTLAR
jgi:hypothetical protein